MIPVSRLIPSPLTHTYLNDVAKSGWYSSHGPYISRFEKAFARWLGVRHAISTTSGTTALHVALASLHITKGDEVIVPTFTMFSPAAAICYTGATPVFVDCDPDSWTMDPNLVEKKITKHTRVILAVHIYGHPVDMDPLKKLAKKYKLFLIEDAAEGLGALYKNKKVGTFGDISCFSFYANKIVTTGEGGMIVTNNDSLAIRCRALCDMAHHPSKRFHHTEIGFTYRMTNMQAALGLASLKQIEKTIQKKRWVAHLYNDKLSSLPHITVQKTKSWATPVYWVYGILIDPRLVTRDVFRNKLLKFGIDTREFFEPAHLQPALKKLGLTFRGRFPNAHRISMYGLYIPSGPEITKKDIVFVCDTIKSNYGHL